MSRMTEMAAEVLDRSTAPALPVDRLREMLSGELPHRAPRSREVLDAAGAPRSPLRVLRHPRRRWASRVGPRAWILAPRSPAAGPFRNISLPAQLRRSLRILAEGVEPGSAIAWARWTRMVEEAVGLRRALGIEGRRGTVGPEPMPRGLRSTTRPPGPPRRG